LLQKRITSAALLIPLVVLAAYLGGWYLAGLLMVAGLLGTKEYLVLVRSMGLYPLDVAALLFVPVAVVDAQVPNEGILRAGVFALAAVSLAAEIAHRNRAGSLHSWGATVASLYIGLGLSYFASLRAMENGLLWVALALAGTWVSDTGAYVVGVRWGKRRLAPVISPSKSWEGVAGGLVTGVLTVWLVGRFGLGLAHWQGVLLGVLLVAVATVGDLAESVIKRQAGAKDSGSLIPGHGGMLDRVDSLLFVAPAVYYAALLLVGAG